MDRTLETTRLETGQFAFEFGLLDLSSCLRETAERMVASPSHTIVLDLPDEPLPCWADGERIGEVVENLLSNAVKYSPGGGEVRLAVRRERETAAVSVRDQGIGIAREKLPLLFRPFSRVHDRKATGIEGFGLGLSICERIARAHGGEFEVESTPGEGSTFTFTLPLFGAGAQSHGPLLVVAAADPGPETRSARSPRDVASRFTRRPTASRRSRPRVAFDPRRWCWTGSCPACEPSRWRRGSRRWRRHGRCP